MNSIFKIFATAAPGAALVVFVGCDSKAPPAGPAAMPPPAVIVAQAQTKDVPMYLDEIGKATALESVTITPRIAGQIVERRFEDGADVKKGQVLFLIDPAPTQAALAAAQAQVAQSKAAADFARIELDRYTAVAGTRAISKSDLDTKQNAVDVAVAQQNAAEAATKTAQINVDFCTVRSPIDGRAGARMVDVGNVVKENEAELLSVQKLDPIYAEFTVNEQDLVAVRQNMADNTLKAYAKLPSDTDDGREGELTFLDNAVQGQSGTVRLRATVQNHDHHFWPGQLVNVRLVLKTLKDAVLVPNTATQVSQQGLFVFRVDDDEKSPTHLVAAQQIVQVGQQQGDMVVVTSGLKAGDRVVVSGQMLLQPGSPVMIPGPPGGAPPANAAAGAPATQPTSAGKDSKENGST